MINGYVFLAGSIVGALVYGLTLKRRCFSLPYSCLAGLMAVATLQQGTPFTFLLHVVLYSTLFMMAVIDHHYQIIPDSLQLAFLALALLDTRTVHSLSGALVMLVLGYVSDKIIKDGIGGGDIKFLIITGFYLGLMSTSLILFCASSLALFVILFNKHNKHEPIAFGPYLILAFFIVKELFVNNNSF